MKFGEALLRYSHDPVPWTDHENICNQFGFNSMDLMDMDVAQAELKKHWVQSWMCTDTEVGIAVYVLKGIPVCISIQPARKSEEKFHWVNTRAMSAVFSWICANRNEGCDKTVMDLAAELPDFSTEIRLNQPRPVRKR